MEAKYDFLVYAEGGKVACMGHVMRCVTLCVALKQNGISVVFATSTPEVLSYPESFMLKTHVMERFCYKDIIYVAKEYGVKGVLIDKFGYTREEHELVAQSFPLFVHIDDFLYDGPANLVINTSIDYRPNNRGGEWLCGGKYALVRDIFVFTNRVIKEVPTDVLVTTGFADPGNIHLEAIRELQNFNDLKIHVVVGDGYETIIELNELSRQDENVVLYKNCRDISTIVKKCDFAISAAGTTLYEFAAAGLPAISIALYDNQLDNIERVNKKGSIISLGWYQDIDKDDLKNAIGIMYKRKEIREELSKRGREWIDGCGADRISREIQRILKSL